MGEIERSFAHLKNLSSGNWDEVQTCVRAFEAAWGRDPPPAIIDFLPHEEASRLAAIVEIVHVDLELRHKRGLRFPVERYLEDFSELAGDDQIVLDLVEAEFTLRQQLDGDYGFEEARARFPNLSSRLIELFHSRLTASVEVGELETHDQSASTPSVSGNRGAELPRRIGKFEVLEPIGQGSFGTVYRARDPSTDREVAVKVPLVTVSENSEYRERFFREGRVAAQLYHPGIVTVLEVGEDDGTCFIASEFVPGVTLRDMIDKRAFYSPHEAVAIISKILKAIHFAHTKGIFHRDIKPENILITAHEEPKITDFGLARRDEDDVLRTHDGCGIGTPAYMSPEQASGNSHLADARTDIWAIGVLFYELLTGRRPFSGTIVELPRNIVENEPLPLRRIHKHIPRDLEAICLKCLAKDPARRFPSAQHVVDELERWQDGLPITTRSVGVIERWWRLSKRKPATAALVGVSVASVLVLAIVGAWYNHQQRESNIQLHEALAEAKRGQLRAEAAHNHMFMEEADRAIREGRRSDSEQFLARIPHSQRSLDTRLAQYESLLCPYEKAFFNEHSHGVLAAGISPDGSKIVSAGSDGRLVLWDTEKGRAIRILSEGRWEDESRTWLHYFEQHSRATNDANATAVDFFTDLEWAPDGKFVVASTIDGKGVIIDSETAQRRLVLELSTELYTLAITADGGHALFGDASGHVLLVSIDDGQRAQTQRASNSAVLTADWCDGGKQWIVGCDNGHVATLDQLTLQSVSEFEFPAPIWKLDAIRDGNADVVAIGCNLSRIPILRRGSDTRAFEFLQALPLPVGQVKHSAVHTVCFLDAFKICAIDNAGRVSVFDRRESEPDWIVHGIRMNTTSPSNPAQALNENSSFRPFERVGSAVMWSAKTNRLLTTGKDGIIRDWQTNTPSGRRYLRLGASVQLMFDADHNDQLWSIAEDGILRLTDTESEIELASLAAHEAAGVGLSRLSSTGEVVTAGRDGYVRFWRRTSGPISETRYAIVHDRPLISLTASHNGRWIAAVDAAANLCVWELPAAELVWECSLGESDDESMLFGPLGFNCDDTRLIALGRQSVAYAFATSPFSRLSTKIQIGGLGSAVHWHPTHPDYAMTADTSKRYSQIRFNDCTLDIEPRFGFNRDLSYGIAMMATPDARRWVILERNGRVIFVDPHEPRTVLERFSAYDKACALAISKSGDRFVVGHLDGTAEIWDTAVTGPATSVAKQIQSDEEWTARTIIPTTERIQCDGPRCVVLDSSGNVCLLFVRNASVGQKDGHGELYFAKEDARSLELVDKRVQVYPNAVSLVAVGNEFFAAYRRQSETPDAFAGSLCVAQRAEAKNEWRSEIAATGNSGFFPAIWPQDDGVEVIHFSYGHDWLEYTFRDRSQWQTTEFGRRGDGFSLWGAADRNGVFHGVYNTLRPGPPIYSRSGGDQFTRQAIDPAIGSIRSFFVQSDNTPTILAGRSGPARMTSFCLGRVVDGQWRFEDLPDGIDPCTGSLCSDAEGNMCLVSWSPDQKGLTLWRRLGGEWTRTDIEFMLPGQPSWAVLRFDAQGRPVLVVPVQDGAAMSIDVLRPI